MHFGRWAIGWLLLIIGGCGGNPKVDVPGPAAQNAASNSDDLEGARVAILHKQLQADTLYITEDGAQVVAPGNELNAIVDPASKKIAWAAWMCDNPQCPGRQADGRPYLFPWKQPMQLAKEDGTIGMRTPTSEEDFRKLEEYAEQGCPACQKIRNRAAETEAQRRQYLLWRRPYVLPQAAEQRAKLEAESRELRGTEGGAK